jgi:hypothetical protein
MDAQPIRSPEEAARADAEADRHWAATPEAERMVSDAAYRRRYIAARLAEEEKLRSK